MTEKEMLAELYKNGDKGMQLVFDKYSALVYKIVLQKLKDVCSKEDIEETVSDVFVDFYYHFRSVDFEKGSLTAFLITIAQRKAIDCFRKRMRGHLYALSSDDENARELPAFGNSESECLDRLEREMILSNILALGEPDSTIVVRRYLMGDTCKDIGKQLGMSANAVSKRLKRSLEKLRPIMEGVYSDG